MANILLAEDDESMRKFLAMALERAGHKVTATHDGLEALAQLGIPEKPFDLLLTDIVMPGMDGIELAQKATKARPELKVMFITGFAAVAMGQKGQKDPAAPTPNTPRVLSKPFHLNDLVEQVESLLKAA